MSELVRASLGPEPAAGGREDLLLLGTGRRGSEGWYNDVEAVTERDIYTNRDNRDNAWL